MCNSVSTLTLTTTSGLPPRISNMSVCTSANTLTLTSMSDSSTSQVTVKKKIHLIGCSTFVSYLISMILHPKLIKHIWYKHMYIYFFVYDITNIAHFTILRTVTKLSFLYVIVVYSCQSLRSHWATILCLCPINSFKISVQVYFSLDTHQIVTFT